MYERIHRRSIVAGAATMFAGCLGDDDSMATGTTDGDGESGGGGDGDGGAGGEEGGDAEGGAGDATDEESGATEDEETDAADETTEAESDAENPAVGDVEQVGDMELGSPAFEDGETIPEKYARDGENVNPPLQLRNVPTEAESLTIIVDDPDAVEPAGKVWLHWLVWNVPPSQMEIPADWEPTEAVQGENDFGNRGYDGPAPPDAEHTYRFKAYALDATLSVESDASKRAVGEAMQGSVLSQTQLTGTFAP